MFPLGSASRRLTGVPFVTVLIILINLGVFYLELTKGEDFALRWVAVPSEIRSGEHVETLVTSMFLHAGWLHIIGNMIFLWAFGPAMEEAMGSFRFVVFYVLGGIAAMATHIFFADPGSSVPLLGASGAIAAAMGAFLVTYPGDQIRTLIIFFPLVRVVLIPAVVLIGLWIVIQVASVSMETAQASTGGVAYFAHIGGAVFGAATGRLFLR